MKSRRNSLGNEQGLALFATFLMLLLLLSLGAASLVQSMIDLKATFHYKTGLQALMAAESGALHAIGTINQKGGVRNFQEDVVDQWAAANISGTGLLGPAPRTLLGDPRSGYSVTVEQDPLDVQNSGFVVGSGWAPNEARRVVALQVRRGNIFGTQGAIYLADDNFSSFDVDGNHIVVDGRDHRADGLLNPSGYDVPAITTRNDAANNVVTGSIPNSRADQFKGVGYDDSDPTSIKPAVLPLGGPSKRDVDDVVRNILRATPVCPIGAPACVYETNDRSINGGNLPLGTPELPAIIHLTNTSGTKINGNWTGYGIIIAEGPLDINGTAQFFGLVVARGGFDTNMRGNATIRGSVWTYPPTLDIGGSLLIQHSSESLQFADNAGLGRTINGNLPKQLVVVAWDER